MRGSESPSVARYLATQWLLVGVGGRLEAHLHPLTCRHFMILSQRDRAPGGARERTLIVDVEEDRRSGDPIDPLSPIYAICILRMYTSWP